MSVRILVGDSRTALASLPDASVDCCITSPPYFGLRTYGGGAAEIGREGTVQGYVRNLVDVFNDVRRVLKPEGTCWLNLGDCYAASGKVPGRTRKRTEPSYEGSKQATNKGSDKPMGHCPPGFKPKDLMMVPNRVAIALQDDGWWVRSEIVWAKKGGGMPESVKDRPSCSHEKIWMLTKSARHFYNLEAAQLPAVDANTPEEQRSRLRVRQADAKMAQAEVCGRTVHSLHKPGAHEYEGETRRLRNYEDAAHLSVWEMASAQFKDAHFATFPCSLVERCLAIGCPPGGTVLDPFGGAGTVGLVSERLGFNAVLCELNPDYCDMAAERIRADAPLLADVEKEVVA